MDLTTLSPLRACRTFKTVGKMRISELADRPFRHFVRVGRSKLWYKMRILAPARATLSSLRAWSDAQNCGKTQIFTCPSDSFVTLDVSDAQDCGKMQILDLAEQPFRHFVRVGRLKTVVKWTFLTGLNRTTVKKCGKMEVFDRTEPDYRGKLR